MTLKRWGIAFLQLGALLLAVGLVPLAVVAFAFPQAPAAVPILLSLSAAPLGGIALVTGLAMWLVGALRR